MIYGSFLAWQISAAFSSLGRRQKVENIFIIQLLASRQLLRYIMTDLDSAAWMGM